ncbi:hypothetical protein BDV41DRAFT_579995 [Aspergillus transmontanensis]|uniref:Uncharacterized protein n=1 Tax=Aspergillus transmontanensis TaxID=1034304 RepID=A0A5N6VN66_9EURO|nr:hypothetical protein BDV41DRAFT_579995 [Aspergillus transmontanensis]
MQFIILGLCILLGTLAEALPRTDPRKDIGTFTNPGVAKRPRYRYWLPDASVDPEWLADDIVQLAARGAGGTEFLNYFNYGGSDASIGIYMSTVWAKATASDSATSVKLSSGKTVTLDQQGRSKKNVSLSVSGSNLTSWKDLGYQNASSVAYYTSSFLWPKKETGATGAYLVIPPVSHRIRISINGNEIPAVDITSPTTDVSTYLVQGHNTVAITVSSTLHNCLIPIWDQLLTGGAAPTFNYSALEEMGFQPQEYGILGWRLRIPHGYADHQFTTDMMLRKLTTRQVILPDFVKDMKRDPSGGGFVHLGKDGVIRTISGSYEVVDARRLTPEQIKDILDVMPPTVVRKEDFHGVDGTKATGHDALFHPAPGVLPERPTEEEATERRKLVQQARAEYLQAKGDE